MRWFSKYKFPPHAQARRPLAVRRTPNDGPLEYIRHRLSDCTDLSWQPLKTHSSLPLTFIYFDAIIDTKRLQEYVISPLLGESNLQSADDYIATLRDGTFASVQYETTRSPELAVTEILNGKAAMVIGGGPDIVLFDLAKYSKRNISEAHNEVVIVGPQEAFVEQIEDNLSLIRHKLKHPALKTEKHIVGKYTRTGVYILYIEGLCNPDTLDDVRDKVSNIDRDSILGANYVAEYLDNHPFSPFPVIQYTERPDTLSASLLEGRIGIMVDGTPLAIIVPVTFFTLLQSPEDYFQRYLSATWIRWIRLFFVGASFLVPSIYVAITTFHPMMIPSNLLTNIIAARENIPFPALAEVMAMELVFEGLREAGIRIPRPLGQTVSIIGAIVIGQASVQAGIVSSPTVIVVSITGIASFIIPHYELGLSFRLLRFPLLVLGGTLGLFGIIMGLFIMYWHMVTLTSFGVPYLHPLAPLVFEDWKDVFIRIRWPKMKYRPKAYGNDNDNREGGRNGPR